MQKKYTGESSVQSRKFLLTIFFSHERMACTNGTKPVEITHTELYREFLVLQLPPGGGD